MSYKIIDCDQRSPEWYQAKSGVPSASEFSCIVTSDGSPSKQRTKYLYELCGQKLGAIPESGYTSKAMEEGILKESQAKEMYSRDVKPVVQVGFCIHNEGYGASPDGLVEEDGLVEIKCPILSTHIEYLIKQKLPTDYVQQVQGQLLVTGRKYNDFISYYPGLKPLVVRCYRDEVFISRLRAELLKFISELNELTEKLR
jgi:putative phage-type endonuclease